jgi:hypothetical protein
MTVLEKTMSAKIVRRLIVAIKFMPFEDRDKDLPDAELVSTEDLIWVSQKLRAHIAEPLNHPIDVNEWMEEYNDSARKNN